MKVHDKEEDELTILRDYKVMKLHEYHFKVVFNVEISDYSSKPKYSDELQETKQLQWSRIIKPTNDELNRFSPGA